MGLADDARRQLADQAAREEKARDEARRRAEAMTYTYTLDAEAQALVAEFAREMRGLGKPPELLYEASYERSTWTATAVLRGWLSGGSSAVTTDGRLVCVTLQFVTGSYRNLQQMGAVDLGMHWEHYKGFEEDPSKDNPFWRLSRQTLPELTRPDALIDGKPAYRYPDESGPTAYDKEPLRQVLTESLTTYMRLAAEAPPPKKKDPAPALPKRRWFRLGI